MEEREAQAALERDQKAKVRDLVTRPGFQEHLVEWLREQIETSRVQPGDEKAMLYQIGVRDGLEKVQFHLGRLKDAARETE